jgi:hypothetical protein
LSLALVFVVLVFAEAEDSPTSKERPHLQHFRNLFTTTTSRALRNIMGPDEEGKALATAEYWDSRYAQSNGEDPTHEWFRSYEALEPFFKENLFATKLAEKDPKIVHLGTGDSV